jgi:hypothetical protein
MHWALVFIGRIQGYENCKDSYKKHILGPLKAAGHTWDVYLSHNARNVNDNVQAFVKDYDVRTWDQAEFDIETLKSLIGLPMKDGMYNYNAFYMYYHMYRIGKLVKNSGIHYSGILYLRADMIFEEDMYVAPMLEDNTLYTTDVRDCDMFETNLFYGTTESILRFFSLYEILDKYRNEGRAILHQTATFFYHMNQLNLGRVEFKLSYQLEANRRVGNWDWYALPPHLQHLSHLADQIVKK